MSIPTRNSLTRRLTTVALAGAMIAGAAHAAEIYVVHGIPGATVDITVDDAGVLEDLVFQDVSDATMLDAGSYKVDILVSDGMADMFTGDLVLTGNVSLALDEVAVVVAHLDVTGTPTLSKFTVKSSELDMDSTRVMIVHAAEAPTVDVTIKNNDDKKQKVTVRDLGNGSRSFPADVAAGTYKVKVKASDGGDKVATINDLEVSGNNVFVAVGSLFDDPMSFALVPVAIGAEEEPMEPEPES